MFWRLRGMTEWTGTKPGATLNEISRPPLQRETHRREPGTFATLQTCQNVLALYKACGKTQPYRSCKDPSDILAPAVSTAFCSFSNFSARSRLGRLHSISHSTPIFCCIVWHGPPGACCFHLIKVLGIEHRYHQPYKLTPWKYPTESCKTCKIRRGWRIFSFSREFSPSGMVKEKENKTHK